MVPTAAPVHPEYTLGDLELLSNDGVVFRVDRAKLSSLCPGLHTTRPSLALPAPSPSLALFLSTLSGTDPLSTTPASRSVLHALDTLLLLQRYNCTRALQSATTELKVRLLDGDVCPVQAFVLGAHLGDMDLCRTAIVYGDVPASSAAPAKRYSGKAKAKIRTREVKDDDAVFYSSSEDEDDDDEEEEEVEAQGGAGQLTDGDTLAHLERVPSEYRLAMAQAWNASSDPKERGNHFVKAMCLLQPLQS